MDTNDMMYRDPSIIDDLLNQKKRERTKVKETFDKYCQELSDQLLRKNLDYGNAIYKTGLGGILARIFDKQERIRSLLNNGFAGVENETLADTFQDLAGYGILGLIFLEKEEAFFENDFTVKSDTPKWVASKWLEELKELIWDAENSDL